jgi:hypothetical protein
MDINDQILEDFDCLKRRPGMMVLHYANYSYLENYICGFIIGLGRAYHKNLMLDITHWYQEKIKQTSNVYWTTHIARYHNGKPDPELQIILIETTEEYFRLHPDWHKPANPDKVLL